MPNYSRKIGAMKLACDYPAGVVPSWFPSIFGDMMAAHYYAATKMNFVRLDRLSEPFARMVKRYYEVNNIEANFAGAPAAAPQPAVKLTYPIDESRIAIMMSGGKDSVHLLLKLLEVTPKEKVFAIYVKNVNRSESYYESRAVREICTMLGVDYKIIEPTNSIKLNRTGHNIAFREEVCTVLALPYLLQRQIGTVYYGSLVGFTKIDPPMYASNVECLEFLNEWLRPFGFTLKFRNNAAFVATTTYLDVFKEMVEKYPDVLARTSSCYTQLNFREHRYELLKKKFPSLPIYEGCGSCLKCLRINSAILLFDKRIEAAPEAEVRALYAHIFRLWKEYYSKDTSLAEHMSPLMARYT